MDAYPSTKLPPWGHQRTGWDIASRFDEYYFAFDMGCGKTKTAIDYCNGMNAKTVLIVCPKNVMDVWRDQFPIHSPVDFAPVIPVKGTIKSRANETARQINRMNGRPMFVVLNHEAFWRPPLGPVYVKGRMKTPGVLTGLTWDVIIYDEGHRLKAPAGKASWCATRLYGFSRRRLFLSGTPMPHGPMDIYAQYRALNPNIFPRTFTQFRRRYAVMGGFEGRQIIGYRNMDEFNAKVRSRMMVVRKEDVLDLPETMHEERVCDLSPACRRLYDELDREFVTRVGTGEIVATNALTKLLRLQQVAGGFAKLDDGREAVIDDSKLNTLRELLEDLPAREPVVIFCNFTNEIQRIRGMCEKLGRSTGELSGNANDLAAWQEGKFNVLAVQIKSGGVGIDLTRARYCVYFSVGFNRGDYDQSLARTHRPGQTKKVTYYHIIALGTVDRKVYRALKNRRRYRPGHPGRSSDETGGMNPADEIGRHNGPQQRRFHEQFDPLQIRGARSTHCQGRIRQSLVGGQGRVRGARFN